MQPTYSREADAYREKVQAFLAEKLPTNWQGTGRLEGDALATFVEEWRHTLYEAGYLAPGWPVEYGGAGLSALEQVILAEEFVKSGVPSGGPNDVFGIQMLGNTLLQWGTDEQKAHYLPRILSGEDRWCQGYSEPNAGSDLANVALKAELDGDQWVLNGQKIWTSAGHLANHIFTLARTDPDASKHKGISFILVDMRQPGVEVRPIKMISGDSEFNEVFYTDATAPKTEVIGGVNNGWAVAMTLLGYERGEAAATGPIRFKAEIDRLLALAQRTWSGRRSGDAPASRVGIRSGRDHAVQRHARPHTVPGRSSPRSRCGDRQVVLERVSPARHRAGGRHLGRGRVGAFGTGALVCVQHRRRRSAELVRVVGRHVSQRSRRHDLCGFVAGTAQHHRRDGVGSPERTPPAVIRVAVAVARHPSLWITAVRQARRTAPARWWRRPPFLPVPSGDYLRFRLLTQYGDADHRPDPGDAVAFLQWCKEWDRHAR